MLTLIHGNDVASSRKFFLQEREKFFGAFFVQESEVDLTSLAQFLEGGGLFEDSKIVFIEQFLSDRRKSAEKDNIIAYLVKQAKSHTIFLWEGKELDRGVIASLAGAQVKLYKLPSSLFVLMDAIRPGNGKALVKLFHGCLETSEPEMVFFMLVRQLRLLIAVGGGGGETISEVGKMAPWQRGKLEAQAKLFEEERLVELYRGLFEIESLYKTGGLSVSIIAKIDFFLLSI